MESRSCVFTGQCRVNSYLSRKTEKKIKKKLKKRTADAACFEQQSGHQHCEANIKWSAVDNRGTLWVYHGIGSSKRAMQRRPSSGWWVSIDASSDTCNCGIPPQVPLARPLLPPSPSTLTDVFQPSLPPQSPSTLTTFVLSFSTSQPSAWSPLFP